ncbi:TonB-dependent receptor [Plebeiibacterium marinum]|uniref:TonB-dependent receptor n=1 Tax=Plebeiibacterium marinum TaxID=2992111 RepID=A0AAE3MAU1_9BACT|nr:TonB-dependent receptor [Plebeiobacterium marinum]MCW3804285.1 TonB-dependent receptor [Plebeiobacterium marinum]
MSRIVLYTCLFVLSIQGVEAQGVGDVSIKADSVSFHEVVKCLELQTGRRFYYKAEWVEGKTLQLDINKKNLTQALDVICSKAKLVYNFIDDNSVVFTTDYKIKTNYAEEYVDFLQQKEIALKDTVTYVRPERDQEEEKLVNLEYQTFKIGSPSIKPFNKNATLQGVVRDMETGEPLIGTVVYIDELKEGNVTNTYGFYSITVPKGQYKVEYRSMGMRTTYRNIVLQSDGALDVELKSKPTSINEVTVKAQADDKVKNLRMGMEKITLKSLKQLPGGFGEADIIKGTLLLPGVQTVGEASAGFNVRGGAVDQNLILLSGAPIMNTAHFFGFFSGFNADLVKDVTLYKSGVPAKYGGRVSSVLDIVLKDGNRKETKISGGLSPVSGRLTVDSPIKKDKSSFIIGARSTYSNWVLRLLDDVKLKKSKAGFYDVQGNFSFDLDDKNSLYWTAYYSHDNFSYYSEDAYKFNSLASSLKWKRIFNPKLFSTSTLFVSQYDYTLKSRKDSASLHSVQYKLNQYGVKTDFSYSTVQNHKIDFGLSGTLYDLSPGDRKPIGEISLIQAKKLEKEKAVELAVYIGDEFNLLPRVSVSAGLRYSLYGDWGPKTQYKYISGQSRNIDNVIDTLNYGSGQLIQFYSGPEFRFSSNITLSSLSSIKLGVSRMYQYIQMISNTASMSPTDIWKLSDTYIKPQRSDQYSVGFYQKLGKKYNFSTEMYYKQLNNIIDYKGGAQLIMNDHLETDVLNGIGKAYGAEFMFEKNKGKLTGWINYTYSRVLHKIDGEFAEDRVNDGDFFPANYDKPHDFKVVTNYKMSRRLNVSANFFYSTGRPFTAPVAYYEMNDSYRPLYTDRNAVRMDDYMRVDLAATLNGNLIKKKLNHSSWTFAIYNVLGRMNPYSVFFRTEGEEVKGYKMSIYGKPVFTVTYNFKFKGNAKDDF